ncbi:hypothetical protein OC835_006556, partial [Tilletia horrida]
MLLVPVSSLGTTRPAVSTPRPRWILPSRSASSPTCSSSPSSPRCTRLVRASTTSSTRSSSSIT